MPPGSTVTLTVSGDIAGESTFGVTILLEIVPAGGNTGTLEFTPALPIDITQLGDAWPGPGTFSAFDTDPGGTNSVTLNGIIDETNNSIHSSLRDFGPRRKTDTHTKGGRYTIALCVPLSPPPFSDETGDAGAPSFTYAVKGGGRTTRMD
ncbi:MAG: hypothetical protein IIC51_07195 [Planctomycetes bacterium]|nr:hypothetical protein [Planctomycetota bacterium]